VRAGIRGRPERESGPRIVVSVSANVIPQRMPSVAVASRFPRATTPFDSLPEDSPSSAAGRRMLKK